VSFNKVYAAKVGSDLQISKNRKDCSPNKAYDPPENSDGSKHARYVKKENI